LTSKERHGILKIGINSKGFTLLEIIIVVVILGVLASIAAPMFSKAIKTVYRWNAFAMLENIEQAQKVYRLENGFYYPKSDSQGDLDVINQNLSLDLNERYWDFTVESSGCAQAVSSSEQWHMNIGDDEPISGTCS
jgi:prepilin-type N-terminal cleavage/methylation domain-containing protein